MRRRLHYPVMTYQHPEALVSTGELASLLDSSHIRVLDASSKMPNENIDPCADFERRHIPGAVYFDINRICDRKTTLPHMLPSPEDFAVAVGALGVSNGARVVVYDSDGLRYAPRVWWMFRAFGHDNVAVLDGGLPKWIAENRPVASGAANPREYTFRAQFRPELVRNKEQIRSNLDTHAEQVVDARARGRFEGSASESWPGRRGGHIPGSLNLPFGEVTDLHNRTVLPASQLAARFYEQAGVDKNGPIVCSCGSGVTACVLAFGLHLLGRSDVAVYDGSWAEWGLEGDTPVETGPPVAIAAKS